MFLNVVNDLNSSKLIVNVVNYVAQNTIHSERYS